MSANHDYQRAITNGEDEGHGGADDEIREIHALTTSNPPPSSHWRVASWGTASEGTASRENFTTISREFNALVVAGSAMDAGVAGDGDPNGLARVSEEESNRSLAIVPERSPVDGPDPNRSDGGGAAPSRGRTSDDGGCGEASVHRVKMEEAEAKITAWQTAKLAKINNRFKRDEAVINGWECDRIQEATARLKKVERKLEEKKARALEKMQNAVAKEHRKAEEKRASAEAKRGTKVARILELSSLMRAVGRPPVKSCF